jgi:hypothetical protein
MRFALTVVCLIAAVPGANACSFQRDYERPPAFAQYDDAYLAWFAALTDKLKRDADPEIAYAGYYLAEAPPNFNTAPPPPPESLQPAPHNEGAAPPEPPPVLPTPTTGVARVLRMAYCVRNARCDDGVAAWMTVEPDNAFVLMQALMPRHRGRNGDAERLLAQATRYDDYFAGLRALPAKIAARHEVTPPQAPPGYELPPCFAHNRLEIDALLDPKILADPQPFPFAIGTITAAARLRAADLMTNTPLAATAGIRIGVAAASEPGDRERYCRLQARLRALPSTVAYGVDIAELERRFYAELATHTAIDAMETVAREARGGEQVEPPDEAAIAACVALRDGDESD